MNASKREMPRGELHIPPGEPEPDLVQHEPALAFGAPSRDDWQRVVENECARTGNGPVLAHTLAYCPHCRQAWANVAGERFIHRPCPALMPKPSGTAGDLSAVVLPDPSETVQAYSARLREAELAKVKPLWDAATVELVPLLPEQMYRGDYSLGQPQASSTAPSAARSLPPASTNS